MKLFVAVWAIFGACFGIYAGILIEAERDDALVHSHMPFTTVDFLYPHANWVRCIGLSAFYGCILGVIAFCTWRLLLRCIKEVSVSVRGKDASSS